MVNHALFVGVLCSSVCVFPDDFTADLCWCKQSEELGPAGLSGFQPQNCFPWKTCHRYRSLTSTEYKTVKMCFLKLADILNVGCLFYQLLYPLQPPMLRSESTKRAGSKHTFPPISKSTVWITSSGVWRSTWHFFFFFFLQHSVLVIILTPAFPVGLRTFLVCNQIFRQLYRSSPQAEEWISFLGYLFFLILYLRRWQARRSHWHSSGEFRWYKPTQSTWLSILLLLGSAVI